MNVYWTTTAATHPEATFFHRASSSDTSEDTTAGTPAPSSVTKTRPMTTTHSPTPATGALANFADSEPVLPAAVSRNAAPARAPPLSASAVIPAVNFEELFGKFEEEEKIAEAAVVTNVVRGGNRGSRRMSFKLSTAPAQLEEETEFMKAEIERVKAKAREQAEEAMSEVSDDSLPPPLEEAPPLRLGYRDKKFLGRVVADVLDVINDESDSMLGLNKDLGEDSDPEVNEGSQGTIDVDALQVRQMFSRFHRHYSCARREGGEGGGGGGGGGGGTSDDGKSRETKVVRVGPRGKSYVRHMHLRDDNVLSLSTKKKGGRRREVRIDANAEAKLGYSSNDFIDYLGEAKLDALIPEISTCLSLHTPDAVLSMSFPTEAVRNEFYFVLRVLAELWRQSRDGGDAAGSSLSLADPVPTR
eukprot:GHVU01037988.1.p1 GENE.GHVU01037988.1~~GHVU01037988.1.p1  ORF type:complete len:415 (+),score=105.82 GHVU01037988.1:399-1643(+)